ncbi:MAG: hypothetical protein H5U20_00020, partial [Rhodobacteraceae bacterium]|nr:hypothetical protein [Paracoccaceae bacterium]
RTFFLGIADAPSLRMTIEGVEGLLVTVPADQQFNGRLYLTAAAGTPPARASRTELRLWATDVESRSRTFTETVFNGTDRHDDDHDDDHDGRDDRE